ncbi:hypothetical protein [Halalkalibacter urbisdiaboli]|uniref:hypothetical protein n=1 Tax=Halalkalibacter urbisdiaboli TaxID=1960589 RepID=UPI000B448EDE|nr:hypothetical protein [Halalkalibacter urbisdiaboli]
MTYKAQEPKFLWLVLAIITLTYANVLELPWGYVAFLFLAICLVATMIEYHLKIEEDRISFDIRFLRILLKTRVIHADEMKDIHVITLGSKNIVLVNVKKGVRLKLHRFQPKTFANEMTEFAERHNILIHSTAKKVKA